MLAGRLFWADRIPTRKVQKCQISTSRGKPIGLSRLSWIKDRPLAVLRFGGFGQNKDQIWGNLAICPILRSKPLSYRATWLVCSPQKIKLVWISITVLLFLKYMLFVCCSSNAAGKTNFLQCVRESGIHWKCKLGIWSYWSRLVIFGLWHTPRYTGCFFLLVPPKFG